MSVALLGIGTAVPPQSIRQEHAGEHAQRMLQPDASQGRLLKALYRRSGVATRHSVLLRPGDERGESPELYTPREQPDDRGPGTRERMEIFQREIVPLAGQAAVRALDAAGTQRDEITHLVTASCTGFSAPGIDTLLLRRLELPPTVQRTHVGFMGCHGAFNALRVADAFAGSDPHARVLVVAAELCTLHFYYGWDAGRLVANALFADGAGAMVVAPADRTPGTWRARAFGSRVFPDSEDDMTWRIGDHGFEMTLSARVPDLIGEHLRPALEEWLAGHGRRLEDVASWAVHPGGPRILASVEQALGLSPEAMATSRDVLAERGNMSSPTIVRILERMTAEDAPLPCVALGFGPGLAVEAALFDH